MSRNRTTSKYLHIFICVLTVAVLAFASSADPAWAASSFKKVKVKNVKTKVVANKTVQVSWKKVSGANGYEVYYSLKGTGYFKRAAKVKKTASGAKVKGLVIGKTYYFKVRPFKKSRSKTIYGKYSKKVKCLITPAPPKVTVRSLEPTTSKITISFKKSTGAEGYEIWRAEKKKGKYKRVKVLKASQLKFTNTGLKANKWYYYKVRAFAKMGKKKKFGGFSVPIADKTGGNSKYFDLNRISAAKSSLKGKKVLFLGSSVTYGSATGGVSFVDYLAKKDGLVAEKNAKSGTTISTAKSDSYVSRLAQVSYDPKRRLVVCQLSSNDSRYGVKVKAEDGSEESADLTQDPNDPGVAEDDLDELYKKADTIRGSIDYVIAYSNQKLKCPVMFYVLPPFKNTGTFNADFYNNEMRGVLMEASAYWNQKEGYKVYVTDMWTNSSFGFFKAYNEKRDFYMKDSVHPTKAGYYKKYLPVFENSLSKLL